MGSFIKLDKAAKIRIVVFCCLIVWCIYLAVGYSWELSRTNGIFGDLISNPETENFYVDGTDFSAAVTLLGYGAKGLLSFFDIILYIIFMLLYAFISGVLVIVPTLILRFTGLKKHNVTPNEYELTKILYFIGIAISVVAGLIVTKFIGILYVLLYTTIWALIVLIYTCALKKLSSKETTE